MNIIVILSGQYWIILNHKLAMRHNIYYIVLVQNVFLIINLHGVPIKLMWVAHHDFTMWWNFQSGIHVLNVYLFCCVYKNENENLKEITIITIYLSMIYFQVAVESGESAFEYESISIQDNSPVNTDMAFDRSRSHIYVMTQKKVSN